MSSASSRCTSSFSQIFRRAAFEVYTHLRDKCEEEGGDGNIYPNLNPIPPSETRDDELEPPCIILVQGPPRVGKSMLIKSLVKHYTSPEQQNMNDILGPITIITDKKRRLHFVECPDDINAMIDAAKFADVVLLLVDACYGLEAETFEFLNLLRVHGLPKVMGVFTHLDQFKDQLQLKVTLERIRDHFWAEICQGATIYCLHCLDDYEFYQVKGLAECISMLQLRPSWHAANPYVVVDYFEDVTSPEELQKDANCNRNLSLYGYLRGSNINSDAKVHLAGVGDFRLYDVRSTADPLPLSSEMEMEIDYVEPTSHMENKSFRTGTYLRLEVHDVPFQIVENLDPYHPILVGGIGLEEENAGYIQTRLKRHDWSMKLLKSGDPVTVSAGWRRYQTKPIYAFKLNKKQHEIADYIPRYDHCLAMFWGPVAPPLTRIAVVQGNKEAFRITATAVILEPKQDLKIVKESKLKGTPSNIKRMTADVKFTPDIEVAEFKGVSVCTSSGVRGKVKKATKEGMARCTFNIDNKSETDFTPAFPESDSVFMRVFRQVEAPRFFNPLLTALEKEEPVKLTLEQRRGVDIIDGDLRSSSCLKKYITLPCVFKAVPGEPVVVMSEKKRKVETQKERDRSKVEETCKGI